MKLGCIIVFICTFFAFFNLTFVSGTYITIIIIFIATYYHSLIQKYFNMREYTLYYRFNSLVKCFFYQFFMSMNVASTEANLSFCPRHLDLPGQCSNSRSCGEDLNAAFGASAMVQDCIVKILPTICTVAHVAANVKLWKIERLFFASLFSDAQLKCNKI